jgi:HK97 family phage portal protein
MFHMLLTGNAYVWKGMVGRDREIRRLDPLDPSRMTVRMRENETIEYTYRGEDGSTVEFEEGEIWHLRGPSWNSWLGMDAVKLARDAIGLSIATEQAHAERHKNGAQTSGVYSVEGELNSVERFELLAAWMDRHAVGGDRAHKPMILDGNAKFTPTEMTGVDAQHLETRKHQIEEICREFGVMPIMVGHADKTATYASAEQMFLAHVVHTLSPHYERVEQSADVNLLSEEQLAAGFYTKFSPNGLMRGAASDRATFYTQALGAGGHGTAWMTKNEVRALEDLPAVSGGDEISEPTQDATAPADAEV